MSRLNADAKQALANAGITQAAWAREYFTDGKWHGDKCGCSDDRCIGYHHDENEECGCLPALISGYSPQRRAREVYGAAQERWLAQPGGDYAGLHGILLGVIAEKAPELLIEAAEFADKFKSVNHIVAENRTVGG